MAGAVGRRSLGSRLADLIWPPRSLLSRRRVDRPGVIEAELWRELRFLGSPCCRRCGFPFELAVEDGTDCPVCVADPPVYDSARAALAYDDHARRLVLDLKRSGRRDGLPVFAQWMARAGADFLREADLIVPTPLHWRRLQQRKFNQAIWLAQALARVADKPCAVDVLRRVKRGRSQEGASASQRVQNVQGAFAVSSHKRASIEARTIVLVDDVLTTGATAEACTRALKRAKAAKVYVLTLARVVRPSGTRI